MKLNARRRSALRTSQFALPKQRKYPIHDRSHAANAKARATQQHNKGNLSGSQMRTIHRKANAVLRRGYADGGLVTKARTPESLAKEHGFPTTPPTPAPPTKDVGAVKAEIISPSTPKRTPYVGRAPTPVIGARGKDGGFVKGPGGPTADKVPANLSAGEYVIPADVVKKKGRAHFDSMVRNNHKPVLRRGR